MYRTGAFRRWKRSCLGLGLAGGLAASAVFCRPVYADSPVILGETDHYDSSEIYTAVDGNQIPEERLSDNAIEYDELGSLIHANNLSVQEIKKSTDITRKEYEEARDYLRAEAGDSMRDKDEAKDDGEMEVYMEAKSLQAIYNSSAKSYSDRIKDLNKYSANQSRISTERQLTSAAQSLMISWQSLELQKEYTEKLTELYKAQYENTAVSQAAGLATDQEVTAAYNRWMNMSVSADSLADSQETLRQNLYLVLGVEGEEMKLQKIPSADPEHLEEYDLEADTKKAVNNNSQVISERTSTSDLSTAGMNKKTRAESEMEEKVRIKMQQLYEEVTQAKQSYEAARTGFSSAEIRWSNAGQKYSLGMLSEAEYLEEQIQYVQKKTAFESADLALLSAMETYDWAVLGIMTLD